MDELAEDRKLSADARVKLALYMHPAMRKFSAAITWECRFVLDEFWLTHLAALHKLVVLNLYLACTDEILKVVSENCPLLEDINIVSKVENCRNNTAGNFNALRLKLFVSDVGLGYLLKCQKLKRITTNKMLRSHCGGRMMTHDGLRTLVRGLPNLESLRYEDLGSVIASGMSDIDQLALTNLCDNHPCQKNIEEAARLCPRLSHLCLCIPYGEESPMNLNSHRLSEEVVTTLAESSIFPSILEIQHFYYSDAVSNLLQVKGSSLTSLFLHTVNNIGVAELFLIGNVCSNLENLHIKGLGSKFVKDTANKWLASVSLGQPLYKNLKCLYLSGKKWRPSLILDLFMATARGLTSLSVWNSMLSYGVPSTLDDFVQGHEFPQLQSANFCPGCSLSIEALRSFVHKCPKLKHLMLFEHEGLTSQDIQELQKEADSKNLNFKITLQGIS